MRLHPKKLLVNFIKLAIAVVGLWFAIWPPWKPEPVMTWDDRVTIPAGEEINQIKFLDPVNVKVRDEVQAFKSGNWMVQFPRRPLHLWVPERGDIRAPLTDPRVGWTADQLIRELPATYFELVNAKSQAPEPAVQVGLRHLVVKSNKPLLAGAWLIVVIPFLITAWRWRRLMEPQGIHLPLSKCLALTFVGQFYSTFLPGITGGDLVKIIYASRVTGSKTKSAVTILLDRSMGLLALLVIAFFASLLQSPGNKTMRYIALLLGAALLAVALGAVAYFSRRLRRYLGLGRSAAEVKGSRPDSASRLDRVRRKIVDAVLQADETLHLYRGHLGVLVAAFGVSLISQILLPLAAWMAGMAFGMKGGPALYMAYVPLAILAASVPISPPQGFGVTEWILLYFFHNRGVASASQTFALAQAIRFLPILWNLVGSYWVVRGDYSRHQVTKADADAALETSGLIVKQAPPDAAT